MPRRDTDRARPELEGEISALFDLMSFERFAFVMSVLEGYSDQDCSLLLGCARRVVLAARSRALQQTGSVIESHFQRPLTASQEKPVLDDLCSSAFEDLLHV